MSAGYYFRNGAEKEGGELLGAVSGEDVAVVANKYLEIIEFFTKAGFADCDIEVEWVADVSEDIARVINTRALTFFHDQ